MSESGAGECALDSAVEELALKDEEDLDRKDDGVNGQEKQKDDDKEGDLGNEESGDELNEEDGEGDEPSGKEEDSAWREERRNMPKHEIWFMPTLQVYKEELKKLQRACTVLLGPATMEDLSAPRIYQHIQVSKQFRVNFEKKAQEGEEEKFTGYLELIFGCESEAQECAEDLQDFREGLIVRQTLQMDNKEPDHSDITGCTNKDPMHKVTDGACILSVRGIVPSVTKEDLQAFFPKALDVMIPWSYATNSRKWHAYVQFANAEDVDEFAGKPVKLKDHYYKTFKLKSIPTVQELIEAIEHERNAPPQMGAMAGSKRANILMMYRQARHYLDSDEFELDPEKRKQLHASKHLLRNKINTDNKKKKRALKYEEERKESNKNTPRKRSSATNWSGQQKRVRPLMPLLPTPGNRQQWARPVGHMARGRGAWGDRGRGGGRFQNYQRDDFNFEGGMNDPYDEYSGGNARGNITMGGSNMAPMGGGFNNAVDMNPQKAVELIVGLGNMLQQSGIGRGHGPGPAQSSNSAPPPLMSQPSRPPFRGSFQSRRGSRW